MVITDEKHLRLKRADKVRYAKKLRASMTHSERLLWALLRSRQCCGKKFRRQTPIGPYIVDFCCPEKRLIVEIDGGIHFDQVEYDEERDWLLKTHGYIVLHFSNDDIEQNLSVVLRKIRTALQ